MGQERRRRHFTPEEETKVMREYFEKIRPVSELCEAYGMDPSQFSQWKNFLSEGGACDHVDLLHPLGCAPFVNSKRVHWFVG